MPSSALCVCVCVCGGGGGGVNGMLSASLSNPLCVMVGQIKLCPFRLD